MTEEGYRQPQKPISPEKEKELMVMKKRIESILTDPEKEEALRKTREDFVYTFKQLGLDDAQASSLCGEVFELMLQGKRLDEIEQDVLTRFSEISVNDGDEQISLPEMLDRKLSDRAEIIFSQVRGHVEGTNGKVIDYGAGDGQVTQRLHDESKVDIEGVDVRLYPAPNVTVPMREFDGGHTGAEDGAYETAVLTNVMHHESKNEKILEELDRIVAKKLVIIETVPVGESESEMEEDKDRTFMNDYLYNRLFHDADVPVPGTFETPRRWIERFEEHGWTLAHEQDLGFDQPTIKDRHYLLVFERD